jgi:hypothetical protein
MEAKIALILDDDPFKANLVKNWLDNIGVISDIALSYDEALKKTRIKYDFILVDYFLDGKHIGPEFSVIYEKENVGCHIFTYTSHMDVLRNDKIINFTDLEKFLKKRLASAYQYDNRDPYEIYVIDQTGIQINNINLFLKRHETLLLEHDNYFSLQENFMKSVKKEIKQLFSNDNNIWTFIIIVMIIEILLVCATLYLLSQKMVGVP